MQICINTWALYNEGLHLGSWCSLEDYEDTLEELKELQLSYGLDDDIEPYLADWEDDELGVCSEGISLDTLKAIYEQYEGLEEWERDAVRYLVDVHSMDIDEAIVKASDVVVYDIDNFTDLAYEFVEEGLFGDIPESISSYIDYEAIGRDLSYDYDLYDGKIYRLD